MPADLKELWKKVDSTKLYPPFRARVDLLIENCYNRGAQYYIISAFRDVPEQDHLYTLGRSIVNSDGACGCPPSWPIKLPSPGCRQPHKPWGNVVTNARGGQSNHNFAISVDACHDSDPKLYGLQPDWTKAGLQIWSDEAVKLGLESGLLWKFQDPPHVQLKLGLHGILTFPDPAQPHAVDLLTTYQHGGHPAVWKLLDQYQWW